jgi:hypothetical protein
MAKKYQPILEVLEEETTSMMADSVRASSKMIGD